MVTVKFWWKFWWKTSQWFFFDMISLVFPITHAHNNNFFLKFCCCCYFFAVDGGFTPYSNYSVCTKTCGTGVQTRTRSCSNPLPLFGGRNCSGTYVESRKCNTQPCPSKHLTVLEWVLFWCLVLFLQHLIENGSIAIILYVWPTLGCCMHVWSVTMYNQ